MSFEVRVHWDPEARVWWAESEDIIGLVGEAESVESLIEDMRHTIPELMSMNGQTHDPHVEVRFVADRVEDVCVAG